MEVDEANKENTGTLQTSFTKEQIDAANKIKTEKRAEAQRAARARVETFDADKKAKVDADAVDIKIDDE